MPCRERFLAVADGLRWAMLAIHEAGHAVAATRLGCRVCSVSLDPSEIEVVFRRGDWRTELVVLASGDEAVKRAGSVDVSTADERDAQQLCRQAGRSPIYWVDAKRQAAELMEREWPAVERVAATLLDRMHLDGSTVRQLMTGPAPNDAQLTLLRLALWSRTSEVTT